MAVTLKAELPAHDEVNVTDSGNNDFHNDADK